MSRYAELANAFFICQRLKNTSKKLPSFQIQAMGRAFEVHRKTFDFLVHNRNVESYLMRPVCFIGSFTNSPFLVYLIDLPTDSLHALSQKRSL